MHLPSSHPTGTEHLLEILQRMEEQGLCPPKAYGPAGEGGKLFNKKMGAGSGPPGENGLLSHGAYAYPGHRFGDTGEGMVKTRM